MSMGRGVGRVLCGGGDGGGRDYTAVTFTSDRYQKRHLRLGETHERREIASASRLVNASEPRRSMSVCIGLLNTPDGHGFASSSFTLVSGPRSEYLIDSRRGHNH